MLGAPLFTNRFTIFARGEGGFGGDPGPKPTNEMPTRAPDAEVESPTVSHQAALYRLSGDKNPLHWRMKGLRAYFDSCKQDVVWDLVKGADHAGEKRALTGKKAAVILDWLATH